MSIRVCIYTNRKLVMHTNCKYIFNKYKIYILIHQREKEEENAYTCVHTLTYAQLRRKSGFRIETNELRIAQTYSSVYMHVVLE